MNKNNILLIFSLLFFSITRISSQEFTIAFGSCNHQEKYNPFWQDIIQQTPDVWVWGGDNIYADTHNMKKLEKLYTIQKQDSLYLKLTKTIPVLGTWDDHDYGANDGGEEYSKKRESQQLFLDFLDVDKNSPRRQQEGIYHAQTFQTLKGSVKIILLDTRYFRTALTKGTGKMRFQPNKGKGSILGTQQWQWLEKELQESAADFNFVVSSIQVLSSEHGFEKWANFPDETAKLLTLIENSKAKNIIFLSGDRHISELSKKAVSSMSYPMIDFTSSGLTHSYSAFKSEPNKYRTGNVVSDLSYGLIKIDFESQKVTFKMMGKSNTVLQEFTQIYP